MPGPGKFRFLWPGYPLLLYDHCSLDWFNVIAFDQATFSVISPIQHTICQKFCSHHCPTCLVDSIGSFGTDTWELPEPQISILFSVQK